MYMIKKNKPCQQITIHSRAYFLSLKKTDWRVKKSTTHTVKSVINSCERLWLWLNPLCPPTFHMESQSPWINQQNHTSKAVSHKIPLSCLRSLVCFCPEQFSEGRPKRLQPKLFPPAAHQHEYFREHYSRTSRTTEDRKIGIQSLMSNSVTFFDNFWFIEQQSISITI